MRMADYNSEKHEEIKNSQELYVAKKNDLIQKSRYTLPLQQQKILLYLISKIMPDDTIDKLYRVSIREFCAVCNIELDSGKNYNNVRASIKGLADKSVWIKNGKQQILCRWLNEVKLNEDSATIDFSFHNSMKEYLYSLKSQYTQYKLDEVLCMKSKYSIRLYELLKSYEHIEGEVFIPMGVLKTCLGAENYTVFKDFKRRAFEPAITEIRDYSSSIKIEYEYVVGKGRTYSGISFNIISLGNYSTEGHKAMVNKNLKLRDYDVEAAVAEAFGKTKEEYWRE